MSVYSRTDPRDPANTNHAPAWEIELRNGLSAVEKRFGDGESHDGRKSFQRLRDRVERELNGLGASGRARSVALFVDAEGEELGRYALQLPVHEDRVVWDAHPFVSPLVDVVERGTATGIVVVNSDHVRLLKTEMGHVTEPEDSTFTLTLGGDWRSYEAYAHPNPSRGQQGVSHIEQFESRVEDQRARFFEQAAKATSERLGELGWERVVVAAEPQAANGFCEAMPQPLSERLVAKLDFNAGHDDPNAIAAAIAPHLEDLYVQRTVASIAEVCDRAAAGGPAAVGPQETLGALGEARVEHLYLDPGADFSQFAAAAPDSVGGPPEMLGERAVEAAIGAGSRVSALSREESDQLDRAGGMVALLRY